MKLQFFKPKLLLCGIGMMYLTGISAPLVSAQDKNEINEPSNVVEGLQVLISAQQTTFNRSQPVLVNVTLKNLSDQEQVLERGNYGKYFRAIVKNEKNEIMPMTRFGQKIAGGEFGTSPLIMKPKSEITYTYDLSRLVDLSQNDRYQVAFLTTAPIDKKDLTTKNDGENKKPLVIRQPTLISNTLTLSIKDGEVSVAQTVIPLVVSTNKNKQASLEKAQEGGWTVGDNWNLKITIYGLDSPRPVISSAAKDRLPAALKKQLEQKEQTNVPQQPVAVDNYTMQVTIAGTEKAAGFECWQVDFLPDPNSELYAREQPYRILVDKKTRLPRSVIGLKGNGNPSVSQFGKVAFLPYAPPGFPLELLPFQSTEDYVGAFSGQENAKLTIKQDENGRTLTAEYTEGDQVLWEVKQTWQDKASWWSEYEKKDNLRKTLLRATLIK